MFNVFVIFTLIALVALVVAERREVRWAIWVAKPLASTGFIAAAVSRGAMDTPHGQAMLVAFALSWLGDVLLIGKTKTAFLLGLVAFLAGHLGFVAAFVIRGTHPTVTAMAFGGLMLPAVGVLRWLWPHVPSNLRGPVVAYVVVISTMVAASVSLVGVDVLIVIGAVAFYLSDICVARHRFVQPEFLNKLVGLPLYYVAQLILAATI